MKLTEIQNEILAILFAAGEPTELARMAEALDITQNEAMDGIRGVSLWLEDQQSPLELRRLEDSYQLCTKARYADVIRRTLEIKKNIPLSAAAMETLAIVAYNQPVTRGFVEQVRGVDSSSVVLSLVEKNLLEEAGRMDLPGRPIAYRTTANFLRCFGLSGLHQLPAVEDEPEPDAASDDAEEQITLEESLNTRKE